MGTYLAIGIAYEIHVNKKESIRPVGDLESLKSSLNRRYNSTGLYDCHTHEGNAFLTLKDDILREEWIGLLETFYNLRYPNWTDDGNVLKALKETNDPQSWLSEAYEPMRTSAYLYGGSREYFYQKDYHYDYIDYREKYYSWDIPTTVYSVNLSVDGKAYMEFFGYGVIDFFERLIKDRLQQYRLRDALNIYYTL